MPTQSEIVAATNQYLMPNYGRLPLAMAKGRGAKIWDADGREYIDFFPGFGAAGVAGHCHPDIVQAVTEQANALLCHGNLFTNQPQVELAEAIIRHSFPGKVFYCHSGAEADEAALKLVRLAAGPGRYKIISFENCFHGRTMGSLSLTPAKFQAGFEPMLPGNVMLPLGDLSAVEKAIDAETAGIFVEPIQGEGGVNMPGKAFMRGLRALCDEHNLLLVCDEVWTAPARTGRWFAYQHYGITPDVMTVAKAVGGGLPVGVCLAGEKYQDILQPGKHGCTMGGNPLCAAAGLAAMKLIEREHLVERAAELGEKIVKTLGDAKLAGVKEVRGAGVMIGIELNGPREDLMAKTIQRGLLVNLTAGYRVLRLAPPLTIAESLLDEGLGILVEALRA